MKTFRGQQLRGINEYGKETNVNQEMEEVLPNVMGNEIDLIISEEEKLIASEQIEIAHQ